MSDFEFLEPEPVNHTQLLALKTARDLLNRGWCQFDFARDSQGNPVGPNHPDATCFCAVGALRATMPPGRGQDNMDDRINCVRLLNEQLYRRHGTDFKAVSTWNDQEERTQGQVLALYDDAIKEARRRVQ